MEHEDNQPTDEQLAKLESQVTDTLIAEIAKRPDQPMPDTDNMVNLGKIVITKGANADLGNKVCLALSFCQMVHVWGNDLCDEDRQLNNDAVKNGQRILSSWKLGDGEYYVITEWDRSATTILRKEEY